MVSHPSAVLRILVLGALLAGCAPAEPTELRVDARNFNAYNWWRSHAAGRFTPDGWREFNAAVDEIRMRAMRRGASGTEAVGEALCQMVNGLTIPDVLRKGDEARLERLAADRDKLKAVVDANALVAALPGDAKAEQTLADDQADHVDQLRRMQTEIAAAKQQLIAHGGTVPPGLDDGAAPAVLSREQALQEFDRMLKRRAQWAADHYGDWPAKIDLTGAQLPAETRTAFRHKQQEAKANGHDVVAVYMRADWRIYDQAPQFPAFSDAVMGNLTEADRRALRDQWALSDAEIWARKQASAETHEVTFGHMKERMKAAVPDIRVEPASQGMRVIEDGEPKR